MKISIIGAGYVGLVTALTLAELGHEVTVVENDKKKLASLKDYRVPFYEPGLGQLIRNLYQKGNIVFTNSMAKATQKSDIIFITVGTPSLPNGEADLSAVFEVARHIAENMKDYKTIVIKSTVPVGTSDKVKEIIQHSLVNSVSFAVASNPEFLREGSALFDARHPERVVIGSDSRKAIDQLTKLYNDFDCPILITDPRSAEMIKYASNAFLATKISFINEIANICEKVGADVTQVAKGMGLDKRIGPDFLNAGIGYGGSCFPKDTRALIQIAGHAQYNFKLLKAVVEVNNDQCNSVIDKLTRKYGNLQGKQVGIWGLSFKPNTDDLREAPSLRIISSLLDLGATVKVYDPKAVIPDNEQVVNTCKDPYDAAKGTDALVLVTEWDEFKNVDLYKVLDLMKYPFFIDGRNVFDPETMLTIGFEYYSTGRPPYDKRYIINVDKMLAQVGI